MNIGMDTQWNPFNKLTNMSVKKESCFIFIIVVKGITTIYYTTDNL